MLNFAIFRKLETCHPWQKKNPPNKKQIKPLPYPRILCLKFLFIWNVRRTV